MLFTQEKKKILNWVMFEERYRVRLFKLFLGRLWNLSALKISGNQINNVSLPTHKSNYKN